MGWVSAQQLFSPNSIGRIDPKGLAYNDRNTVLKIFHMLPMGQAENNIGRACSTKDFVLYGFIDFGMRCVFVSAGSSGLVKDFMENIHVGFEWYKLYGKFIEKLYRYIPGSYLNAPNCFILPGRLKNEAGKIPFLSGGQGVFDYAFEHLSPIVYRSEMDRLWSECGMIDGFVVTLLAWNIMNREDPGIVLAEVPKYSKQSLSTRGALGKVLVPCFQNLTRENIIELADIEML